MTIFKLPDLGEGLPDAEIVAWHVKVGDIIHLDQSLVSMETAKAVVEIPSPVAGRVVKLFGEPGDIIKTGAPLIEFVSEDQGTVVGKVEVGNHVLPPESILMSAKINESANLYSSIKATPAIRALAKRLNVDLNTVVASGPNGTVLTEDVERAQSQIQGSLEPLKGVRRHMAQIMSQSYKEVVPVTVMEDAHLFHWTNNEDITVKLIQAMIHACQKEPSLNAWFDGKVQSRCLLSEVHLGLAMDTEEGLFVPVIHNAEKMDAQSLRKKIEDYKGQVRDRSIAKEDLKGASITLSNFGKFAGRYANPIIITPMVAILGVGKLRNEVVVQQSEMKICPVLPLALTVDHRAVTGGEATRFLSEVITNLEKN